MPSLVDRRAVEYEGEVIACVVTKKRDKKAASKLLRKLMKRGMSPSEIVPDKLKPYGAAIRNLDYAGDLVSDKGSNNRADVASAASSARAVNAAAPVNGNAAVVVSIRSQIHNHFNNERHFLSRKNHKMTRAQSIQE
ncbi:MAG: DDE-type integrase/transposase/recombinase [Oceanococcus sp.]